MSQLRMDTASAVTYQLGVLTSKCYKDGSTDADVLVQLVGESGNATEWHKLDNAWRDDFERGRADKFEFTDVDIGRALILKMQLKCGPRKDIWCCDTVTARHGQYVDEFPVYDWVFDEISVIRGDAILPKSDNWEKLKKLIDEEIKSNKERLPWSEKTKPGDPTWMLPRFSPAKNVHDVPHQLKIEDSRFEHISECRRDAQLNVVFSRMRNFLFPIKELDDYKRMITCFKIPGEHKPFLKRWDQDDEQGRQMLNGTSPFGIACCKSLPSYCKITNEHVKGLLNCGKTLEDEMKDGRIFIADYTEWTRGLPRNTRYQSDKSMYCADGLGLFYAPGDGRFLPIAVQLKPDDENYVFTPNDDKHDWMLAKMHFRCADTNAHQWIFHFLWSHAVIETAAVAMFRCLSRTHPIYKLCRTHLQHVVVIDQFARDILIFDNSPTNYTRSMNGSTMAAHFFKNFDFNDLNLAKLMKKKGLDSDKLQNYHFREDAMMLYEALEKYVAKIVRIYYKTDQEVQNDGQIQDWVHEYALEGLGWMDGNPRGSPTCLTSIDELISFVATLISGGCIIHTATHSPMLDLYKFVPNSPGGMRMPIHKKGEGSMERILDSLPDVTMATILLGTAYTLTNMAEDEVYLGNFSMRLFVEPEPLKVLNELCEDLKIITEKTQERNKTLENPYDYLLPENVPVGTTI